MSFSGQLVRGLDLMTVQALLAKLNSKLTIGFLLELKAQAQGLNLIDNARSGLNQLAPSLPPIKSCDSPPLLSTSKHYYISLLTNMSFNFTSRSWFISFI